MGEIECLYELRPTAALGQQAWNIAGRLLRRNTRGLYITAKRSRLNLTACLRPSASTRPVVFSPSSADVVWRRCVTNSRDVKQKKKSCGSEEQCVTSPRKLLKNAFYLERVYCPVAPQPDWAAANSCTARCRSSDWVGLKLIELWSMQHSRNWQLSFCVFRLLPAECKFSINMPSIN